MTDKCNRVDTALYGAGSGNSNTSTTQIEPPTASDQIPVSAQDPATGQFKYEARANPFPVLQASDAGKGLIVDAADPQNIRYATEFVVKEDEAVQSILDNTGVINRPTPGFTSPNIFTTTPIKAVFYSGTRGIRSVVDIPASTVTITRSGTGNAGDDVTYLLLNPDGSFTQSDTEPTVAQRRTQIYLAKIFHPDGGPIEDVRPAYTFYGNDQATRHDIGLIVGLRDIGFIFERNAATGEVSQTGANARILGLNIRVTGDDRNIVEFPAGVITVDYYSFDPARRDPAFTDFNTNYFLDDPAGGTSSTLTDFGILVILAGTDGGYLVMAPQKNFNTLDDALQARTEYVGSIQYPAGLYDSHIAVGTAIVSPTVTDTAGTFELETIGDVAIVGGSRVTGGASVPDPSSGNADDIVAVDTQASSYVLKADGVPDATGVANGEVLKVQNGQLTYGPFDPTQVDSIFPVAEFPRVAILMLDQSGNIVGSTGNTQFFDLTVPVDVSRVPDRVRIESAGSSSANQSYSYIVIGWCFAAFSDGVNTIGAIPNQYASYRLFPFGITSAGTSITLTGDAVPFTSSEIISRGLYLKQLTIWFFTF